MAGADREPSIDAATSIAGRAAVAGDVRPRTAGDTADAGTAGANSAARETTIVHATLAIGRVARVATIPTSAPGIRVHATRSAGTRLVS